MKLRLFSSLMLLVLLFSTISPAYAQGSDPSGLATALMAQLSPEEKVGQLFLVTFKGTSVTPDSQIYDLIVNHHIGGVVLTAANDNFVAAPDTVTEAYRVVSDLQRVDWEGAQAPTASPANYIPLFTGISQEGGGAPNDQILNGLTPLPSQMAIGATWDRSLAEQAGQVMGKELSTLGFNLYFGLSLDVLSTPSPSTSSDLNTRVFGGDPYWVGELGRAFISGIHTGSDDRMAVIAKHFPGRGGSDRPVEQEVATVRRSLDELKQIELPPFFAVTGDAPSPDMTTDGLLVSHIRYQGFQGNIRATTRPVSFDQQALSQILSLTQFASWRQNGGLMVTDDLGTPAVRKFYDPDNLGFQARLVARDAFLAGNDLLYMGNITSSDAPDNYTTIVNTLNYFTQKYQEDPAFAQRVNDSVHRILTLKYRLYSSFSISTVQSASTPQALASLGQSSDLVFSLARQAATLISPSPSDLPSVLPSPPTARDYIVFLSDSRTNRQCSTCPDVPNLDTNALQNAVLHLYGPNAGGVVIPSHLSSYSFDDLDLLLKNQSPTPDLLDDLRRADWVVISTLDLPDGQPQTATLQQFLSDQQSLLLNKKVVMFSFSAPYYLDATDISKLTAFYGLYSVSAPFVEVAARILFQEITPAGALPVSVPAIGYDLITATSPDPAQVISLQLNQPAALTPEAGNTPVPTTVPLFRVGDTISVQTGTILDHNQHAVPDGTVVRFVLSQGESGLIQQVETTTTQGVAQAAFRLDQPGLIQINATSDPARTSDTIQLNVSNEGATVIIITPTALESPTSAPTVQVSPEPRETPATLVMSDGFPTFFGWLLIVLVMAAGAVLTYWLATQVLDLRWALRWALLVFLGGLLTYNYLVLGFPGGKDWLSGRGLPGFLQAVVLGQVLGLALGWGWHSMSERGNQAEKQHGGHESE